MRIFSKLEQGIELALVALFPIFFLPILPDPVGQGKLYFLLAVVVLLLLVKGVKVLLTRKIAWSPTPYDALMILLGVSSLLTLIVVAPNKIESLLDPVRGAAFVLALVVLYFLLQKKQRVHIAFAAFVGLVIAAVMGALSYFGLFNWVPEPVLFLKQKLFAVSGGFLGLGIYAAMLAALVFPHIVRQSEPDSKKSGPSIFDIVVFAGSVCIAFFAGFVVLKNQMLTFVPYVITWQTFVETLKSPISAVIGVGQANYPTIFSVAKPIGFNSLENLWTAVPFLGTSAFLHVGTELGLLGIIVFLFIFILLFRQARKVDTQYAVIVLAAAFLLLPLSQMLVWSLFLLMLITQPQHRSEKSADLHNLPVVYIPLTLLAFGSAVTLGYFGYREFMAEVHFRNSVVATSKDKAQTAYDEIQKAITDNPFREDFHLSYAQLNLLVANSIAQRKDLKDADRQNISQLLQQGIQEARNAVVLNNRRADYWGNLGDTYRNIIALAQGADVWTITAYQQAISRDPLNPVYQYNLGSVYYGLKNYREAVRFFEGAVQRKPDIPNYHYNLAWAYFQNQQYREAVSQLEATVALVKDKKSDDYKKVQKDLEEFKKRLAEMEAPVQGQVEQPLSPETLVQPSPAPSITPQISLPARNNAPPTTSPQPTVRP